jgi:hypothetical protein
LDNPPKEKTAANDLLYLGHQRDKSRLDKFLFRTRYHTFVTRSRVIFMTPSHRRDRAFAQRSWTQAGAQTLTERTRSRHSPEATAPGLRLAKAADAGDSSVWRKWPDSQLL